MDILVNNGDIFTQADGRRVEIRGINEAVQRVRIATLTAKGSFIYDRSLGTDYSGVSASDPLLKERMDMLYKEACAGIQGVGVRVLNVDSSEMTVAIEVSTADDIRTTEVDFSGYIRTDT